MNSVSVTQMVTYTGVDTSMGNGGNSAPAGPVAWDLVTDKPAFSTVSTSGSYADLSDKPAMFSGAYSELTNKPVLFSGIYADLSGRPSLFSGSYADLTNKPASFPAAWSDVTGKPVLFSGAYSDLTGKPALFSGSYTDLTNKPASFSGAWADITGKPSFFSGSYADLTNKPDFTVMQRRRVQTSTAGLYVWTFPTPYATGVIPVISVSVEDATPNAQWGHQITSVNNISATIQLSKTTPVTLLAVSVLGVSANPQAFIHLTAIAP